MGHSAVRRYVMGDDASERRATADEIAAMQDLVRRAMREGAIGFSSSQLDIHVGDDGREVPSNHASPDELIALCSVLAEFDRGAVEFIPRSFAEGYDDADRELILEMYRVSGRPVELNVLVPTPAAPDGLGAHAAVRQPGLRAGRAPAPDVLDQQAARPPAARATRSCSTRCRCGATSSPGPSRSGRASCATRRCESGCARRWPSRDGAPSCSTWDSIEVEAVREPRNRHLVGRRPSTEIAAATGADPLDCFLDLALDDDLETPFRTRLTEVASAFIRHVVGTSVADPIVMAGSSDAGAHLASFVGADYTTRLLAEWVPDPLTLEAAVSRLTMMPATVHGLADRGVLRNGAWADIVVFDPAALGAGEARLVQDFPAGSSRYVVDATGYALTVVNGEVVMEKGKYTGALPGTVLRGG